MSSKETLSEYFKFLVTIFEAMDTQISLCHKRSIRPTFFAVKTGVEIQSKRRFEEYHLASIVHICPTSFLISSFVSDCKTQDEDNLNWIIERPSRPGKRKGGHMFTERSTAFKQSLATFEAQNIDCHNAQLETFRKMRLPRKTGAVNHRKRGRSTAVECLYRGTGIEMPSRPPSKSARTNVTNKSAAQRSKSKKVTCGVTEALLAKIRARQSHKKRREAASKSRCLANRFAALPAFCDQLNSYFLHKTRKKQFLGVLVTELQTKCPSSVTTDDVERRLRWLTKLVPEWCSTQTFQRVAKKTKHEAAQTKHDVNEHIETLFVLSAKVDYAVIRRKVCSIANERQ